MGDGERDWERRTENGGRGTGDGEFGAKRRYGASMVGSPASDKRFVPLPSFPVPRSPFPVPRSPFPVPRSPFPVPRSPFPVPRSPFPDMAKAYDAAYYQRWYRNPRTRVTSDRV